MAGTSVSLIGREDECRTDDVRLAAGLLAMGVPPKFDKVGFQVVRPDRPGNWQEFFFEERTRCGKWTTKELMSAWRGGLEWIAANQDHPFAYIMAAMANHRDLSAYLRCGDEFAFLRKGKSVAMLPVHASAALEEQILGKF